MKEESGKTGLKLNIKKAETEQHQKTHEKKKKGS